MSKITLNIIENGNPAPADPGGGSVNTGLFTHGIGAPEAAIMLGAVLFLVILSLVLANYTYKKHKKAGRTTRLVHLVERLKTVLKNKKQVFAGLAAIAVVVTISSSTAFMQNTDGDDEETAEGGLALNVSDTDFTIEIDDEPVFAVMPVEVTVEEATEAGYTLTAYANNTSLVSTTNDSNIIPMVTMDEDELAALAENSYGLSLTEPESKDSNVYMSLSTNSSKPTIITDKNYEATEANDTVTLYYGFYVVPGVQAGTYQSSDIKYKATANRTDLAIVTFDGNGLHFNNDETRTSNVVRYATGAVTPYINKYSFTPNINENGVIQVKPLSMISLVLTKFKLMSHIPKAMVVQMMKMTTSLSGRATIQTILQQVISIVRFVLSTTRMVNMSLVLIKTQRPMLMAIR